jgi:hypothetical protein
MKHTKAGREQNTLRYKSAKRSAEALNDIVKDIRRKAGAPLTGEQIRSLIGLFSMVEYYIEEAEKSWERYSDHCDDFNYDKKDIEHLI